MSKKHDHDLKHFFSYSLFRQLSNDPPPPAGKMMSPLSFECKSHHFDTGNPAWTQPMVTTHQDQFVLKPMKDLRHNFKPPGATESKVRLDMDAERRLKSTVQADYRAHSIPAKTGIAKPSLRNESGIVMGEDKPAYDTTYGANMRTFRVKPELKSKAPIRYDIITNGIKTIQETAPFDYWNPAQPKLRISKNRTALPEIKQQYNILNGWPVKAKGATSMPADGLTTV